MKKLGRPKGEKKVIITGLVTTQVDRMIRKTAAKERKSIGAVISERFSENFLQA